MDGLIVETVDGELLERDKARALSRRVFYAGFALLPWLWGVNTWMFWPDVRHGAAAGGDAVVSKYARRSAACFAAWLLVFLPWMLLYAIAGRELISPGVYQALDAYRIDLAALGISF